MTALRQLTTASTTVSRLRAAITTLIAAAKARGARAIVIENLNFADARAEGRERAARPSRGQRGRGFRRLISGIPTGRFRDRLTQMACNAGLSVIVIDPSYTSRGNQAAPEDAARPAQARTRTIPAAGTAPRKPAAPRDPRQPPGAKTGRPHRDTAGDQAAQHRPGPPARQGHVLPAQ